jgi:hypothetical protein
VTVVARRVTTPLPALAVAGALPVLVAWAGFAFSSGTPPFVPRLAELTLAAAAAYLLDDAAAPLTSTTPRRVWRRRAPNLLTGGAALVLAWLAVLVLLEAHGSGLPAGRATTELVGLSCGTVAAAAVCVRRGEREPGNLVATGVVLLGLAAMLVEWVTGRSVFVPPDDPARAQLVWWLLAALAGCLVAAVASREPGTR